MLTKYLNNNEMFKKLNTISKYPSILTYHKIGDRGCLNDLLSFPEMLDMHCSGYASEKIDGTNSRIIIHSDSADYVIGSREDLLYSKGDRIVSALNDICVNIHPIATKIANKLSVFENKIFIVYGETYGGKITKGSKNYISSKDDYGFRIFDIIEFNLLEFEQLINEKSVSELSYWRDAMNQPYVSVSRLKQYCELIGVKPVDYLMEFNLSDMPSDLKGMYAFIQPYKLTNAGLNGASGSSEGIVVRTEDRRYIVKIRFEDYERTFKRMGK